jgi:hypothetical protein
MISNSIKIFHGSKEMTSKGLSEQLICVKSTILAIRQS